MNNSKKIKQIILNKLKEQGKDIENINFSADFYTLGIDSLDLVEINQAIEKTYIISSDFEKLLSINNLNELLSFFDEMIKNV